MRVGTGPDTGPEQPSGSDKETDFDPAAEFSPPVSDSDSDMSPSGAFSDSDDSDVDPDGAFSPHATPIVGPFTAADFGPIREEDLEPSD